MRRTSLLLFALILLCFSPSNAADLSGKANVFLNSLSSELRALAQFPLADEERFNMNFVPMSRKGPTFNDFNEEQKKAAIDLLRASLSQQGYQKATEIMELEKVLIIIEKQAPESSYRDPMNYHFCIFGEPSPSKPWGWRFEGHHISLNFASADGRIVSSTPSFFGSNPGTVNIEEQKGKQVLKAETELGFLLVNSLNAEQLKLARFSGQAPREIITGNDRKAGNIEPRGIPYSKLTESQQQTFLKLLDTYVRNYEFGFADELMRKIREAGLENLSFAWAGGLQPGIAQYYRIQGPMLLIEYDNIQNNANHVHTVVRDLTNDFAEDILREHYRKAHK